MSYEEFQKSIEETDSCRVLSLPLVVVIESDDSQESSDELVVE